MNQLYKQLGISRQAHHQQVKSARNGKLMEQTLAREVIHLRMDHPKMGLRKIYDLLNPSGIGRDKFERMMVSSGLRIKRIRNYRRTTRSRSRYALPNLIKGKKLTAVNQVWVSDITYIRVQDRFHYLSFITDVYSRKIVGYSVSKNLLAEANISSLQMALKDRSGVELKGLIHHSDRRSQYIDSQYRKLLKAQGIVSSMGNKAWENAHAERLNGIIKNEYIIPAHPQNYQQLKKVVRMSVAKYNKQRPHGALPHRMTPVEFEEGIRQMSSKKEYHFYINY